MQFKNSYIQKIFQLQKNVKFKKSFDFICKQLRPFKEYIFYMPAVPAKSFPVEVEVAKETGGGFDGKQKCWKINSVKHNNVELYHPRNSYENVQAKDVFINKLASLLTVPLDQLTLTWSEPVKDGELIGVPYEFSVSRFPPEEVSVAF